MVAVDTNVLVRLLTGDHAAQYKASVELFAREQIFIPISVLLETEWVLRAAFDLPPDRIQEGLRRVLGLPNVSVADSQRISRALDWHRKGLDFADAVHLALSDDHETLKTFDAAFIRRAKALSDCRVEKP